jgi:hypothetical protein
MKLQALSEDNFFRGETSGSGEIKYFFEFNHRDMKSDNIMLSYGKHKEFRLPDIIKDAFEVEYLGETGEGGLKRDFYRMVCKSS